MDIIPRFATPGLAFVLTVVFGFWLSRVGKPYNGILFNFHKLIALGTVILVGIQLYKILQSLQAQTLIIVPVATAGICVVSLFASGAFMSIGNLNYDAMKTVHNIAFAVVVIAMALVIYLMFRSAL